MDMGQMMAVVQQMPASQDVVAGGEVVGQMEQNGLFAGVLQGLSVQRADQAQLMAQNASQGIPNLESSSQMPLDVVAALLSRGGNGVSVMTPDIADVTSQVVVADVRQERDDSESQNVTTDLNEAQMAQMFAQLQGKMPDVAVMPIIQEHQEGIQSSRLTDMPESAGPVKAIVTSAGSGTTVQAVPEKIESRPAVSQTSVRMADAVVAPIGSETVRPPLTGDNSTGGLQEVAAKVSGEVLPAQFKMETTVTEGGKTVVPVEQNRSRLDVERSADVLEKQAGSRIENSLRQGVEVPRTQTQAVKSVNPKAFTDVSVKAPAPSAPVQKGTPLVVGTENMVLQLDTPEKNGSVAQRSMSLPEAQSTQMPRPVETQVAAQVVTPVQLQAAKQTASQVDVEAVKHVVEQSVSLAADLADVSVPQPEQAIQQKVRTSTHLVPLAAAPVTEVLPENNPVRINPRDASKILNVEKVDPVTNIVAVATDEKNFGSDGERPNQSANSNVLSNTMHQQVKTEGLAAVGTVAGTDTNNSSRSSQPAEQVVQQVRERLVNHVTKPGSEQIVLRLSPEHLGDLRVNLNLEGQRLKVEIVAENSTVRDSLLQNTDLLKESLSRQNIKMESFDVTTGGNGTADNSRGQGEWRELAQRRQQNLWMPEGGYRTAKQAAPAVAAYQQKSQHTMLDVHF